MRQWLDLETSPRPEYLLALARALFETGSFGEAADTYRRVLGQALDHLHREDWADPHRMIRASLVWSLRQAGRLDDAVRVQDEQVRACRNDEDRIRALPLLAQLHALNTHPELVVTVLQEHEALLRSSELPSWLVGTVISIGEISRATRDQLRQVLERHPEAALLVRAIGDYWPRYRELTPTAKKRWSIAVGLHYIPQAAGGGAELQRVAFLEYFGAVEVELRARVFDTFRNHAIGVPKLMQAVTAAVKDADDPSSGLARFVVNKGKLPTGDMASLLKPHGKGAGDLLVEFDRWVTTTQPELGKHLRPLEELCSLRNPGTHEGAEPAIDITRLSENCRRVLTAIRPA